MNIQQFQAAVRSTHPEFVNFVHDDYRNQYTASTEFPATIVTYDCEEGTYTVAFNGGMGVGETIEAAFASFEEDYNRIQRNYELSRLS